jgi:hypothetical protein
MTPDGAATHGWHRASIARSPRIGVVRPHLTRQDDLLLAFETVRTFPDPTCLQDRCRGFESLRAHPAQRLCTVVVRLNRAERLGLPAWRRAFEMSASGNSPAVATVGVVVVSAVAEHMSA